MSGFFATLNPSTSGQHGGSARATEAQRLLAEFPDYAGAERLVDQLSDRGFPVEHTRIVGTDLRSVEQVTGRLTSRGAAVAGAASGAWLGLLVGLVVGLFSDGATWVGVLVGSPLMGAVWLGLFGWFAQRLTGGRRDFASVHRLEAGQYAVYVQAARLDEALRLDLL